MLRSEPVTAELKQYEELRRLYYASFPEDERIPWYHLFTDADDGRQMLAWFDDDMLIGLTYVFRHEDIAYVGYLAVEEELRNRGYGSEILKAVCFMYALHRVVVDIEIVDKNAENYEERLHRRDFYLRNGFQRTGIGYYIFNVDYELLSAHGTVTKQEFRDLISAHWGSFGTASVTAEMKDIEA